MDEFVPVFSSLEPFPAIYRNYTSGNHITMVKPPNIEDTSFQIIKSALAPNSTILDNFDYTALNNKIGEYYEIIQQSKDQLKLLDSRKLREYIFALEGVGKIDEAIIAIKNSEWIQTNTDLMGVLGGRYKRKYLTEGLNSYLNEAIEWYKKALDLSIANDNHQQIFYHSINLAFLYLIENDQDLTRVKEMAGKALLSCEKNAQADFWELATMAEAYLYLNDFEKCQKFYQEAIVKADHGIHEISSMMINAIYACNSLNKLDWKRKLEGVFL
jgi:tetratricopeptide (TPR) repeat protein